MVVTRKRYPIVMDIWYDQCHRNSLALSPSRRIHGHFRCQILSFIQNSPAFLPSAEKFHYQFNLKVQEQKVYRRQGWMSAGHWYWRYFLLRFNLFQYTNLPEENQDPTWLSQGSRVSNFHPQDISNIFQGLLSTDGAVFRDAAGPTRFLRVRGPWGLVRWCDLGT